MANITIGILRALLTADTAKFESGMRQAANSAKVFSRDLKKVGQEATQIGTQLTKTITLPILGLGVAVSKMAMDFESSFAGVKKTVQATDAEFKEMSDSLRALAREIPVNVNELNRLAEAAGALGIPKAEIVDFARVMALLGVTTNLTADQAAEGIAKIQNIFGAAGEATENFASTLVALGNDGASTESQILEMATRIAGAANAIGMSQGEVLAFASALSSVGIEAEMGGSAISRVMLEIASAVSEGGDAVADFAMVAGQSTAEFSRLFKEDAAAAVNAFITGLGNIKQSGGDLIGTLEALGFQEIRVRDTLLRTAGAGDLLTNALNLQGVAWRENSALTEEARKRFETTSSQLALLWNRVKDVGITLGNALLPMIQATIGALDKLLPIIEKMATAFTGLPTPVQATVVGLGLAAAAAGPALYVFGQLALSASALVSMFPKLAAASTAAATVMRSAWLGVLGPIGLAAGAIALLHEGAERYGAYVKMSDADLRKQIETFKASGNAQAILRVKHLETLLAQRQQAAEAAKLATEIEKVDEATQDATAAQAQATVALDFAADATDRLTAARHRSILALNAEMQAAQASAAHVSQFAGLIEAYTGARRTGGGLLESNANAMALSQYPAYGGDPIGTGAMKGDDGFRPGAQVATGWLSGFGDTIKSQLGPTIMQALTGGGSITKSVAGLFGGKLTESLFGGEGIQKSISSIFGKTIGGALNSFLPGIGSLVGPAITGIGKLFGKLFGGEGKKVNDMRDEFIGAAGGLHELNVQAVAAGTNLDRLLAAKKVKDFEAAVEELRVKMGDFAADQAADAALLQEAYQAYGFTFEQMAASSQKADLDGRALKLTQHWRVLVQEFGATALVNEKMSESVSDYLATALKVGAEIPAAMEPILQSMIDQGVLVDENGVKITDLEAAGVTFSQTMTQGFDRVVAKLQELLEGLGLTSNAIANLPDVDMAVNVRYNDPGFTPGAIDVAADQGIGFAGGTPGLGFMDFGAGTLATLHGREAVVPEDAAGQFAAQFGGSDMGGVEQRLDVVAAESASLRREFRLMPTMMLAALRERPA